MTNEIKLSSVVFDVTMPVDMLQDYVANAVAKAIAQRDADHLAELRAYELTVANLREQLAQRGEPVAWKWRFADGDLSESPFESRSECERDAVGYDGEAIPLYTHPQAPQVPMTEAAAENLATTSWILHGLLNPWDEMNNGDEQSSVLPDMVRLIRAVEAFHNIQEKP